MREYFREPYHQYTSRGESYITAPKHRLSELADHLRRQAEEINTGGYWDYRFKITFNRVSQEWEARVLYV